MSAKLMGQIWDLDLPHAEAWVLMALADHADHDGANAFPGQELLAYKTGYSTRQVRRILDKLKRKRIIAAQGGGKGRGGVTRYQIFLQNAPLKTGQNVRLSARRKEDKMSGLSEPKRGQNVPQKEDRMSAFSDEKADILTPEKGTFSTEKADISDISHDKERARDNRHEPSIEPSEREEEPPALSDIDSLANSLCSLYRIPDNAGWRLKDKFQSLAIELHGIGATLVEVQNFYTSRQKKPGVEFFASDFVAWRASQTKNSARVGSNGSAGKTQIPDPDPPRPRGGQWGKALNLLDATIGREAVVSWFEPLEYLGVEGDQVLLRCPDPVFRDWINGNYSTQFADALREAGLGDEVSFV